MNEVRNIRRQAFTLVEVIATTAIMAVLTTSSFAVVRTAHDAWLRHRIDSEQRREAIAVLQHLVRRVRQATSVTAISAASDLSGALTVLMPDSTSSAWDHSAGTNQVLYGSPTATSLLAQSITELSFAGLGADGITATVDPALIHAVRCTIRYNLTRPSGSVAEAVSSVAWLRAW